jgi:hypothetical protein
MGIDSNFRRKSYVLRKLMRPLACKARKQEFKIADQIFANDIRGRRNSANGKVLMVKLPVAAVDSVGNLCSRRSVGVNVENAGNREET